MQVTDPHQTTRPRTSIEIAMTPTLADILSHIANRNSYGIAAKFPTAEMIRAAEGAERDGLIEWRDGGRWLTLKGKQARHG